MSTEPAAHQLQDAPSIAHLTDSEWEFQVRALVDSAARELEGAPAEDVLRWASAAFSNTFVLTSSMTDTVLVHMAATVVPETPVLFVDTGYHFPETLETLERVGSRYGLQVLIVRPPLSVAEQDHRFGARLYERDPDLCCRMRKVQPLDRALAGFRCWGSGLRRSDSEARRDTPVVQWDERRRMVKVNPLATWSDEDLDGYTERHGIEGNPLLSLGYPSIGCAPCTAQVGPGADPRSGRWANTTKVECGIHQLHAGNSVPVSWR